MPNRITHKLDTTATPILATVDAAVPVPNWDAPAVPGQPKPQAFDEDGNGIWVIDGLLDDGSDRANTVGIRVASKNPPEVKRFQPLNFSSLTVTAYVNRKTGQMGVTYEGELAPAGSGRRSNNADQAAA